MRSFSLFVIALALALITTVAPTPGACASDEWTLFIPSRTMTSPMKITPQMPEGYVADAVPPALNDIDDLRSGRVTEREPGMPERVSEDHITLLDDMHGDGQKQARAYLRSGRGQKPTPVEKSMSSLPLNFPYLDVQELPEPWSAADAEGAAWFMKLDGDYSLLVRDDERIWVSSDVRLTFTRRDDDTSHRHRYRLLSDDDGEFGTYPVGTHREEIQGDLEVWLVTCLNESLEKLVAGD